MNPDFSVPAEFFYALAVNQPGMSPADQLTFAYSRSETLLYSLFQQAIDAGTIEPAPSGMTPMQAARRVTSLGAARATAAGYTVAPAAGPPASQPAQQVYTLVEAWLADSGNTLPAGSTDTAAADATTWQNLLAGGPPATGNQQAQLRLVVCALTGWDDPQLGQFVSQLAAMFNVATADDLATLTQAQWTAFFAAPGNASLLPPSTDPPSQTLSTSDRTELFLRTLTRFYAPPPAAGTISAPAAGAAPSLDRYGFDPLQAFLAAYDGANASPYEFGVSSPDDAAAQAAIAVVFSEPAAAAWLAAALVMLGDLAQVSAGLVPAGSANAAALEFSVMEALYARGFTSQADIAALDEADFASALTSSVAFQWASQIWTSAGGGPHPAPPAPGPFRPVNPDGTLTDCVPPPELSPLGPVAYLAELLAAGPSSTCTAPAASGVTFGTLLAGRRGDLGSLQASKANLETPVPSVDLVNECLENLAAGAASGVVYNTGQDDLLAVPQYSSPAVPVAEPAGYATLSTDFSAPELPYAQPLDVVRGYLAAAGSTRFAAMRAFRAQVTEFVLQPESDPAGFDTTVWRYPVRSDIAPEYLGIAPGEYQALPSVPLWQLYGYPAQTLPSGQPWDQAVLALNEFLPRTGLSYCEFIDLTGCGFIEFAGTYPSCEPCCLADVRIGFPAGQDLDQALFELAVFIRLWRALRACYGFAELADIVAVLGLFTGGALNPRFIPELAAFGMLREEFGLPLGVASGQGQTGAERTRLLGLWAGSSAPAARSWAIGQLLEHLDGYARREHGCERHRPDLLKILAAKLDELSALAGFTPGNPPGTWDASPARTLRYAEILAKVYASPFSVGDIEFVCTAAPHLDGDDPFELQPDNEAADDPLGLPSGGPHAHALWRLRRRLLDAEVDEEELARWTWWRIDSALRTDLGYDPPSGTDPLLSLAQHCFPGVLEAQGQPVPPSGRQYRTTLSVTSPGIWNSDPDGPFRYDASNTSLSATLPLRDESVLGTLARTRQLSPDEQNAVRELYFQPRADLAAVGFLFPDLPQADRELLQGGDEESRWAYFLRHFALARRRCQIIAEEVARAAGGEDPGEDAIRGAHLLLRHLYADENFATSSWEGDQPAGAPPAVTWPAPAGGAYAALLGLCGTGLLTAYTDAGGTLAWQETSGSLREFGEVRDRWNAPVPTLIPGLQAAGTQTSYAEVRNGIALASRDGERLGGAQGYEVTWTGVLLVEDGGRYRFDAGAPAPGATWQITLARGQRSWVLLSHGWPGQDDLPRLTETDLRHGGYDIAISYWRAAPDLSGAVHPLHTGLELSYAGPDTGGDLVSVPRDRLFIKFKDAPLADDRDDKLGQAVQSALHARYVSTLRDIRRTYQRAVKAMMLVSRFRLEARPGEDGQSELGYLLDHPDRFAGSCFYGDSSGFTQHQAQLDVNFLPLLDNYFPPDPTQDLRVQPTAQRQTALFDWWERLFDYTALRYRNRRAPRPLLWRLFQSASELKPDDPAQLLPFLDVELDHTDLVQTFYGLQSLLGRAELAARDLTDERWAVRVSRAGSWAREVDARCLNPGLAGHRPDLWAADDPLAGSPPGAGDLTGFVRGALAEHRGDDLRRLDDALRERARAALLAYLCRMDRVALPFAPAGTTASSPRDVSDLLLLDVNAGLCERASRIDDAISAVQGFVLRARLGLEPGISLGLEFRRVWDERLATFRTWQACKRRELYPENWIEWSELERARRHEAFRFLEENLRRPDLSVPVPAGLQFWDDPGPFGPPGLPALQAAEPATLHLPVPADNQPADAAVPAENFGLIGRPGWAGQPSWLAPVPAEPASASPPPSGTADPPANSAGPLPRTTAGPLPLWIEAAVRLGARFLRVAAAGEPAGSAVLAPAPEADRCCADCGRVHPPTMDEYYFWLAGASYYDLPPAQDGDLFEGAGQTSSWEDPAQFPTLLYWASQPMVYLHWCRATCGRFGELGRSSEGVALDPAVLGAEPGPPTLELRGRMEDCLVFAVDGGTVPASMGGTSFGWAPPYPKWPVDHGWRFDLADDAATLLPLVATPPAPGLFGGLSAYPFFAYFAPGAALVPLSRFAPAVAVAGALRAHCRFEDALRWYARYHDAQSGDNGWCQAEPPPPGNDGNDGNDGRNAVRQPVSACCQNTPPSPPAARRRAVLLDTLETLLRWGDATMARHDGCAPNGSAHDGGDAPEYFAQARVVFDAAARILGRTPETVLLADATPATPPPADTAPAQQAQTVGAFTPLPAPLNPRLMSLYQQVADRLRLIRDCGNRRRRRYGPMPYWGDDPVRDGWRTSQERCCDPDQWCDPRSPYRFTFLVQRAIELAGEVQSFGGQLLSTTEKGDAEFLALLRAAQEHQVLRLGLTSRQDAYRDADWQVQALEQSKLSAQDQLAYYTGLIQGGLNSGESLYQDLMGVAIPLEVTGQAMELAASIGGVTPDMYVGTGYFAKIPMTGSSATDFFTALGKAASYAAQDARTGAELSNTEGGWSRRSADWQHQVEIYGIEIEQIQRQILGAERRADAALHDLNSTQRQIENAAEVTGFLRGKFTSQALYLPYQQQCAGLHRELYELAIQTARQAEHAYNYERGFTAERFIEGELWDSLREGLLAGDRLQAALHRMNKSYLDRNRREYELTKHISLRMQAPEQYLLLRRTGRCEVELPEWLFDLDYPGHYLRRIKNVSLSLPCVVGPYTGVHCRLTLLSSGTRVDPRLIRPPHGCCHDRDHCGCDGAGYDPLPDDPRFVREYLALDAIATSSGRDDSGLFQLSFGDERYLPFEFRGAASRWRLELPLDTNYFPRDTLTDVVLHVNYTAREGGDALREAAGRAAACRLPGDGLRVFDVREELPGALRRPPERPWELDLRLTRDMFPFLPGRPELSVEAVRVLFEAPGADPGRHRMLRLERHGRPPADIPAVAGERWPGCFQAALPPHALGRDRLIRPGEPADLGMLAFPGDTDVGEVFVLCRYNRHDQR